MKYLAKVCTSAITLGLLMASGSVAASAHRIYRSNFHQPRTEITKRTTVKTYPLYHFHNHQREILPKWHFHHHHRTLKAIRKRTASVNITRHHLNHPKNNETNSKSINNPNPNIHNVNNVSHSNSAEPSNDNGIVNHPNDNHRALKFAKSNMSKLAKTKLGDPYEWGATGDNAFDCSGFTQYLYRNAKHINLPRTAQAQYDYEKHVSYNHIKPGNLVFFGTSPQAIGHVGMYIGNGKMIDAQLRGVVIENVQAPWWNLVGCAKVHRNYNY